MIKRFFLNLKMERVWQRDYANHAEATSDIADYIVSFYNSMRLHSKLATQCLRASIGNHTTYRGVRNDLTRTLSVNLPRAASPRGARHSGSRVIATASRPGNIGWVMELDAAQALDHHQPAD